MAEADNIFICFGVLSTGTEDNTSTDYNNRPRDHRSARGSGERRQRSSGEEIDEGHPFAAHRSHVRFGETGTKRIFVSAAAVWVRVA